MKKKELAKLQEKSVAELKKSVAELSVKKISKMANLTVGREKNFKVAKNIKHDIAQIMTVIRQKQLAEKKDEKAQKKLVTK